MAERDMKIKGIKGRLPDAKHKQVGYLGRMLAMIQIRNIESAEAAAKIKENLPKASAERDENEAELIAFEHWWDAMSEEI